MPNRIPTVKTRSDLSALGIRVTPAQMRKLTQEKQAALEDWEAFQEGEQDPQDAFEQSTLERLNARVPDLLDAIQNTASIILAVAESVIVSLGIPIMLILLLIVEQERIFNGVRFFEESTSLARLAALTLVFFNLVLEFAVHYIEAKAGYKAAAGYRFSLRLLRKQMAYFFGLSPLEDKSPATRYKGLLRLATWTIALLTILGSTQHLIAQQDGAWYVAIGNILVGSSLRDMGSLLGALALTFFAVRGSQGLTAYIAVQVADFVTVQRSRSTQNVSKRKAQREAILAAAEEDFYKRLAADKLMPSVKGNSNGNGNGYHKEALDHFFPVGTSTN